ncbi:MAG: tetratricopeptide repeat protein, partial [Chthoniobacterales bacterium]
MPSFPDYHESEAELSPTPRPTGKRAVFGCVAIALLFLGLLIFFGLWAAKEVRSSMRGTAALQQGVDLIQEGQFTAAWSALTTALENRLTTAQQAFALGDRGWSLTKLDRDPEAIRDFSAALALDPNLGFARIDRGLAYHRQGKYDEALADYDRAIAGDPNLVDVYRNRALILAQR